MIFFLEGPVDCLHLNNLVVLIGDSFHVPGEWSPTKLSFNSEYSSDYQNPSLMFIGTTFILTSSGNVFAMCSGLA